MAKQMTYFVHHVLFWLRKPVSRKEKARFEEGLQRLASIETIVEMHVGVPGTTRGGVVDRTYTYSLVVTFMNKDGHDIYDSHPVHLEFIEEFAGLWDRVVVYDSVAR